MGYLDYELVPEIKQIIKELDEVNKQLQARLEKGYALIEDLKSKGDEENLRKADERYDRLSEIKERVALCLDLLKNESVIAIKSANEVTITFVKSLR